MWITSILFSCLLKSCKIALWRRVLSLRRQEFLNQEIACLFQNPKNHYPVGFEVFTAVTMNNAVFWDVTPCRSYVNRRFGGTSFPSSR
jgi:hypothetical protein